MSYFKKFLLERDESLYNDLVGFDPQSKSKAEDKKPKDKEPKAKEPENKGSSRRAFLGGAAAALGLGALGGISSMNRRPRKSTAIAPAFKDEEDEELPEPNYYDHEEEKSPQSSSSGSGSGSGSRPDPEKYLKSLGPIRRIGANNDPNSYYHQIGGQKQGLFSRLFGKKKR